MEFPARAANHSKTSVVALLLWLTRNVRNTLAIALRLLNRRVGANRYVAYAISLLGVIPMAASALTLSPYSCPSGQLTSYLANPYIINESNGTLHATPACAVGSIYFDPNAAWQACVFPTGAVAPTYGAYDGSTPALTLVWGAPNLLFTWPNGGSESRITQDPYRKSDGAGPIATYYSVVDLYAQCAAAKFFVQAPPPGQGEPSSSNSVGEPINPATGNVFKIEHDIAIAGPSGGLAFDRYYSSADASGTDMGPGWRHSFDRSIVVNTQPTAARTYPGQSFSVSPQYANAASACTQGFASIQSAVGGWANATSSYVNNVCVISTSSGTIGTLPIYSNGLGTPASNPVEYDVIRDDGQVIRYTTQNGVVNAPPGVSLRLTVTGSGFTLQDEQDNIESYSASGVLQSVAARSGVVQSLSYDTNGRLSTITDSFGSALTIARSTWGAVASITANGGGVVRYGYDGLGRLTMVTNLDGTTRGYTYGDSRFANALTAETDENGAQLNVWAYDGQERGVTTQQAGGANATSIIYNGDGSATVTDALNAVRTFTYQRIGDVSRPTSISGSQCQTCQEMAATTYDAGGYVASRTDYDGNVTQYSLDDNRGLEISRTEAYGTSSARTITTQWNATWREPDLITEPNRTTAFAYDSMGNALTRTITDTAASPHVSRTWTYTYDTFGRVLTADGPRIDVSDVTTYTYYTCTTGYQCGQIQTIMNAAGQVTTYNTYNVYGKPLTITDANGVVTTLAYDARQRLISRQVGSEMTSFAYWPTGLLKKVTLPDGSYVLYSYDNAHRLTQISDAVGNSIDYTLDALGNRTAESVYDPSNALHRAHTRVFNTLSELYQDVNAAGTAAVTTTYGYDGQGNQTSAAAPLGRNTGNAYDELNRLKQITDPASGVIRLAYNGNDNLTSVTDPRNLVTSYGYDGFGDLLSQVSPDAGTTTNTYDSAGNLATSTDARGAVATYSYDVLNRVTSVSYSQGGTADQAISFTYDAGPNGKGHLTGASDANHSMSWSYDALGRVTSKSQTVGGVSHFVGYGYTNGNLTSLTTPSGQAVTYGYDGNHRVTSIAVNGATVLNGVTYEPLGPVNGWTWSNGTTTTRTYDTDGKITQIASNGTKTFNYDDAFRVTGITDTSAGSGNWTYGYDALDRLTSGTSASVSRGWTYDANGNRLTETGSSPSTYTISPISNRISGITGSLARTYGYDATGHTTSYSTMVATYNNAGRLNTVSTGSVSETLVYNAIGQRIESIGGASGTVLYWYDEEGRLLGEYDGSGNLIEETVWLGDTPVATLRPGGSGVATYYVHTDQLNTPRQVTRPSDNAQMWTWFSDPFGTDGANANPVGAGTFPYNMRFQGQMFDGLVGLHSNGYRDFDPASGTYVEGDPIGLWGGSYSTYSFAGDNPIQNFDALGLATAVVYSGAVSGNPAGHIGLGFSDAGVYSYGTGEPYGSSLTDYVNGQAASRDVTIAIIKTTPAQERVMQEVYAQAHKTPYSLGAHNCANIAGEALLAAGIAPEYLGSKYGPLAMPALPSSIFGAAEYQRGAQIVQVPQGASSPAILKQFNPK